MSYSFQAYRIPISAWPKMFEELRAWMQRHAPEIEKLDEIRVKDAVEGAYTRYDYFKSKRGAYGLPEDIKVQLFMDDDGKHYILRWLGRDVNQLDRAHEAHPHWPLAGVHYFDGSEVPEEDRPNKEIADRVARQAGRREYFIAYVWDEDDARRHLDQPVDKQLIERVQARLNQKVSPVIIRMTSRMWETSLQDYRYRFNKVKDKQPVRDSGQTLHAELVAEIEPLLIKLQTAGEAYEQWAMDNEAYVAPDDPRLLGTHGPSRAISQRLSMLEALTNTELEEPS